VKSFYIFGRSQKSINVLKSTLKRLGFEYKRNPDIMISLGGDGTFLYAEREYPGIPKLLMRDSKICEKCEDMGFDELFMKIHLNNYKIITYPKLEATFRKKKYIATNDFVVRNRTPIHAIRFRVKVDEKEYDELIGDGVVISTSFGSTGYHKSITRIKFDQGIGLAFNNTTKEMKHKVLHQNSVIKIKLTRHDADFGIDNDPRVRTVKEGETITVRRSKQNAEVVRVI